MIKLRWVTPSIVHRQYPEGLTGRQKGTSWPLDPVRESVSGKVGSVAPEVIPRTMSLIRSRLELDGDVKIDTNTLSSF